MADDNVREEIIRELSVAYWMELETVMNYISSSINLDGVRAEEIKKSLAADVTAAHDEPPHSKHHDAYA